MLWDVLMNSVEEYNEKAFENIKHIDEYGDEYWKL